MQNLTKEDLMKIHFNLVKISGEEPDTLSKYKLNVIIHKHEKAETLVKKAAVLLHDIPNLQPFSEGNKRTAFSGFKVFMELNDRKVTISNKELEDVILRCVNDNITLKGVEKWLKRRIEWQETNL